MKIIFLGTSHGYPEKDRFCSSTAVMVGEKCYLIDAGAPISTLLMTNGVAFENLGGIFITHPHSDHTRGLIEFCNMMNRYRLYRHIHPKIYVSVRNPLSDTMGLFSFLRMTGGRCKFIRYKSGVIFDDGIVKITALTVMHCIGSHAFIVEAEGKRVMFSGDLFDNMPDYPKILKKEHFDMLILEGAHTALDTSTPVKNVNESNIDRLYINHISPRKNPESRIENMFKQIKPGVECHIARDRMVVEL